MKKSVHFGHVIKFKRLINNSEKQRGGGIQPPKKVISQRKNIKTDNLGMLPI